MRHYCLLMVLCRLTAAGEDVIIDHHYEGGTHRAVLVDRHEFGRAKAIAISESFVKSQSEIPFSKLEIGTERYQVQRVPRPPFAPFDYWMRNYERLKSLTWRMAETVCFDRGAVMRIRTDGDSVERIVLRGQDPLMGNTGFGAYEIVHIELTTSPSGGLANVSVFVKTSWEPDTSSGEAVARTVVQQLPFKRVNVFLRSDPWFIQDRAFPDYYAFVINLRPPNESEYNASRTVYCGIRAGRVWCKMRQG